MPSKQQLLEDNDVLLDLLADIDDAVDLPDALQDRVDEWFDDDDGDGEYEEVITINPRNPKRKAAAEDDDAA